MKKCSLAALAVLLFATAAAGIAQAAPADVSVRIEGKTGTVFDRVVRTDGHDIQAASDTAARKCDGTNLGANPLPGPTATAASVDAMTINGTDFDGNWYDGFDDYFITRWGPEAEDNDNGWWWGILVNREFTPVGGCQFRVSGGDEVLWVLEAFNGRPFLSLDGPGKAVAGRPVEVVVSDFTGATYEGATVSGLTAAAVPVSETVTVPGLSEADGTAEVTFTQPGWKRLKATDRGTGAISEAVPSNSIDICVERVAGSGCTGEAPSRIPAEAGTPPAVEVVEPGTDPEPDPTCETDPTLCPPVDPGPRPESEAKPELRFGRVDMGSRRVRPGGLATVGLTVRNAGEGRAGSAEVWVGEARKTRRARAVRIARPCRTIGPLEPGAERRLRFKVKVPRLAGRGTKLALRVGLNSDEGPGLSKVVRLGVTGT